MDIINQSEERFRQSSRAIVTTEKGEEALIRIPQRESGYLVTSGSVVIYVCVLYRGELPQGVNQLPR